MARVLVTGAAGFIGSHVVEALLDRGDQVVGFDNFDSYYDPGLKWRNAMQALGNPDYDLMEGDLRNEEDVTAVFQYGPFDGIIHLAARAGVRPSLADPGLYNEVNVLGTARLLEASRVHGTSTFIFGSSSSVYGATTPPPFRESEPCDRPSSPYAATKRACEISCYAYHHLYGMDITCLRFFTVYGPRQRPEMAIHKFARLISGNQPVELYGDGTSYRDYTFVRDVTSGVLAALDRAAGYRVYNLGTTDTTRLIDLVGMLGERLECVPDIRFYGDQPGDVPLTFADISLAERDLDYRPTTRLADGLDLFIDWLKSDSAIEYDVIDARPPTGALT